MTRPRSELINEHANNIYEALVNAMADGFQIKVDQHGRLDLVDADEADNREPLLTVHKEER